MIEKMLTVSVRNQIQPIHWHDRLEINLVLQGEINVVRNNRSFSVKEGELIVLNRDDVHSISSESDNLLYVQLHINMEEFNQYIPDIWTILVYCSPEDDDAISRNLKAEIKSHISSIINLMEEQNTNIDAENKMILYCIDILSSFKMGFAAASNPAAKMMSEEQLSRLWKTIDYMYDNHNRKLTLHEVAQQIHVGDDYLSRLLKKLHGMGFEQFLGFIRAEMSIKLLLNTEMSITGIAYECGFSAPKYYNSAFEKTYGCSPAEYRKNNKANFLIEKNRETAEVIYEEGVDSENVKKLLTKYQLFIEEFSIEPQLVEFSISKPEESGEQTYEITLPSKPRRSITDYILQRAIADVMFPCVKLAENIYAWTEKNAVKILLFNADNIYTKEIRVRIRSLDTAATYVYCRAKTPDIPETIMNITDSGKVIHLHRDIIDHMYDMAYEYGEVKGEENIFMNMELKNNQIAQILIQRIETETNK